MSGSRSRAGDELATSHAEVASHDLPSRGRSVTAGLRSEPAPEVYEGRGWKVAFHSPAREASESTPDLLLHSRHRLGTWNASPLRLYFDVMRRKGSRSDIAQNASRARDRRCL
jgi:hypothetical protein